ncbi:EamA family transporter [uncultured Vibrio sp.]|uniref:EamA family transporter n=1 Tax=uncultured Vibrio sp. TaxID=114054 RepID=UPI00262DF8ED|nr:EamA family transporter [uncultured Vibrio sp.]
MPQTSWLFWALLSAVFAAMTAVFTKLGVNTINSDFATFIRTCVILVLVTAIAFATKQFQPISSISGKGLTFLVLSGLATGASWLCYFRAMNLGQASQVAPIDKLSVVLVAIFSVMLLGEQLSTTNWFGIVLITVGVILVAWQN